MSSLSEFLRSKKSAYAVIFLAIFHLIGVIGFHLEALKPLFLTLVPLNMLLSVVVLGLFHRDWTGKFAFTLFLMYLISFLAEVFGVNTGLLFGNYTYYAPLGWQLWSTPLIIGINWVIPAYCAYVALQPFVFTRWWHITLSAASMVVLDILIEPVAMRFNWWMWFYDAEKTQPYELLRAPVENYAAWFVIGFIIIYLLDKLRQRRTNPIAAPLLLIQFVFFGICLVLAMAGQ